MAAFLYRLANVKSFEVSAETKALFNDVNAETSHLNEVYWLAQTGVSKGWENADGTCSFRALDSIARSDTAAFLQRLVKTDDWKASGWKQY